MLKNKRRLVFSVVAGLIFSSFFVCGYQYNHNHALNWNFWSIFFFFLFLAVFSFVFYFIFNIHHKIKTNENFELKRWQIFLPLMILSILLLFAIYPGKFCYDIMTQYGIYWDGAYNTHYPPAFCFIFGIIVDFGTFIFGDQNAGLALFLFLQSLITVFVITEILYYVSNKIKNKTFYRIVLFYFIFHPLIQVLMLSSCHDVLFGAMFAAVVLEVLKISEDDLYFVKKTNWLKIFVFTFLMCIFRNNGLFALIPAIIISLFFIKENRIKFSAIFLIPILVYVVGYNTIFLNIIKVERESVFKESLSVPVMQIARTVYYDYTLTDKNELDKYFNKYCYWRFYGKHQSFADDIKACLDGNGVEKDLMGFISLWAKTGLKAPHYYVEAAGMLSLGLYYPWTNYPEDSYNHSITYHAYEEYYMRPADGRAKELNYIRITGQPNIPILDDFLGDFIWKKQSWSYVPVFRLIWCGAFSTFMFVISTLFAFYKKQRKCFLPLSFIFGMLLTISLSPVIIFRYIFPVVLTTPIMLYIIVKCVSAKR